MPSPRTCPWTQRLFRALVEVDASVLAQDGQRYLAHALRDFRRAGVDKDEATRTRLKALAEEAVVLGQTFDRAIREDVRSRQAAAGAAGRASGGLPGRAPARATTGCVTVTTDYPDLLPFRQYAHDGEARRALYVENAARAWPANEKTLRALLEVRAEQARLLGYASWADYVTEDKMARSAETVRRFLDNVAPASEQRARADLARLLERKRKDVPSAERVEDWEKAYYEERVKQEAFAFDSQSVRPYFEFRPHPRRPARHLQSPLRRQLPESRRRRRVAPSVDVYDVAARARRPRPHLPGPSPAAGQVQARGAIPAGRRAFVACQRPEGVLVCNFAGPAGRPPRRCSTTTTW